MSNPLKLLPWNGEKDQDIPPGYKRRGCGTLCACTGRCNDLVPIGYKYDPDSEAVLEDERNKLREASMTHFHNNHRFENISECPWCRK